MKLSFSTNAYTRFPLAEAVRRIAAAGYAGVEILADAPHLFPPAFSDSEVERLAALLGDTGLKPANINANTAVGYYGRDFWEPLFEPSLANPVDGERRWRMEYTRRCIEVAGRLRCPSVSVTSGRTVPGASPRRSMDLLRESLRELLPFAEAHSVSLGIEYEPGLLIENARELATLLQEIDSPILGANLDLGHSRVLGESPEEVLRILGGRIFHIHLEDIAGNKHYHLVPGEGDMDFESLVSLLERHRYAGFVTVELYTYPHCPDDAARRSMDRLGPLMRRAGRPGAA
ncbi:MAG: sugar phosphate isomerase/epimerase [Syntrophobacteraceae bacterium]|jgi:sugar phosphate isomerase/epimerase|nr:sugar phosphate isomerase/epimerase [Syntrophobacteraceae bacterium]